MTRIALIAAALAVSTGSLPAQAKRLVGSIRDNLGQPLAGAKVSVRGSKAPATADVDGRFILPGVSDGLIVVTARSTGLVPLVDLRRHTATDTLILVLTRLGARENAAALLQEAEADVKRVGDRYERSAGAARSAKAFTDRDIARRAPAVTTDLFVGLVGFSVDGNASTTSGHPASSCCWRGTATRLSLRDCGQRGWIRPAVLCWSC